MATVLTDIHDLSQYPPFVRRVTAAVVKAAIDVGSEPYTGTQEQIARRALSSKVLQESDYWGDSFADGVAANPVVTVDSTDDEIQFTVNSLWNAYAGAYVETEPPGALPEEAATSVG